MIDVDSQLFFGQITNMAKARFNHILFAQELLYRLGFGWRLDYY